MCTSLQISIYEHVYDKVKNMAPLLGCVLVFDVLKVVIEITQYQVVLKLLQSNDTCIQSFQYTGREKKTARVLSKEEALKKASN